MVNEFVLDDLSSSWTDSFYKNKTNSNSVSGMAPTLYTHIYLYICIQSELCLWECKVKVGAWSNLAPTLFSVVPVWYLEESKCGVKLRQGARVEAQHLTKVKCCAWLNVALEHYSGELPWLLRVKISSAGFDLVKPCAREANPLSGT